MTTEKGKLKKLADQRGVDVKELVTTAINEHGSILAAARALGVTPNAIQYRKKQYGLTTPRKTTVESDDHHD